MSKTDKTKPFWVKVAEHNPTDQHHHDKHDCNLPESARDQLKTDFRWDDCHWATSKHYWMGQFWTCCDGCPCEMCSQRYARRQSNRRTRHQGRAAIRREDWDSLPGRVKDVY